jgi:hypothetical protein
MKSPGYIVHETRWGEFEAVWEEGGLEPHFTTPHIATQICGIRGDGIIAGWADTITWDSDEQGLKAFLEGVKEAEEEIERRGNENEED